MELSHPMPDMAIPALRRLEGTLAGECACGGSHASLVRRQIAYETGPARWSACLQCLTCGRSIDGFYALKDHFKWQSYAEWNPVLRENWEADRLSKFTAAGEKERLAAVAALHARRGQYDTFLRSSPDWRALRMRIVRRSNGTCEACLAAPAVAVHHKTYAFGLLPPAGYLEAVCQKCHDRYHTEGDEWCPTRRFQAAAE
jgi:hypothetical protein